MTNEIIRYSKNVSYKPSECRNLNALLADAKNDLNFDIPDGLLLEKYDTFCW